MRIGDEVLTLSHNGRNVPLEVSALNHVRERAAGFSSSSRVASSNYGQVTPCLSKHAAPRMPSAAAALRQRRPAGRGADARLRAIETEMLQPGAGLVSKAPCPPVFDPGRVQANYRRNWLRTGRMVMIGFQEQLDKAFISPRPDGASGGTVEQHGQRFRDAPGRQCRMPRWRSSATWKRWPKTYGAAQVLEKGFARSATLSVRASRDPSS